MAPLGPTHASLSSISLFSQCYVPSLLTCLSLCLPPSHPPSISSSLPLCLSSSLSSSLPFSLSPLAPLLFYPLFPPLCVSHPFSLYMIFFKSLCLSLSLSLSLSLLSLFPYAMLIFPSVSLVRDTHFHMLIFSAEKEAKLSTC